jgi:hypothetical protein
MGEAVVIKKIPGLEIVKVIRWYQCKYCSDTITRERYGIIVLGKILIEWRGIPLLPNIQLV